jgi:hypothetical protein
LCELAQPVRFLCEMASEASAREVLASETSDFLRIFVLGVGFCERFVGHFLWKTAAQDTFCEGTG